MRKFKVLLVDDEADIIEFLAYNFNKKGFDVSVAYNGEEGFEQAINVHPDIIISDILMPKLNGVNMCQKIKETKELKNIPILFLSATADDLVALTALEAGGDRFMSKPVKLTVLFETIGLLLERYAFFRY